ncbi:ribosomal RNA processing protein 1 homolog [Battus philenor]|uniref:ribosomal RNA processing protein 1 homolog n=1 Tax=Battus philenor TaxID=42288 RepID=UPI0035CFDACD
MKPNNRKEKKQRVKKKPIVKNKKEHVLIVAQEFKFARLLSANEKKTRDRVLKALKKWLLNCFEKGYEFKEDDFIRVWKGLFYAVWMSDKPLIQEELCESIAGILDLFPKDQIKSAMLMTKAGLKMLATEWYGIDQHRMDKFLMLVRRYMRGSFRCLLRCNWSLESCNLYTKMLSSADGILALKTPSYARNALSMILHFIDCFLEELAKVSKGEIPDESLVCLLRPYSTLVCGGEALALCKASQQLLMALLRQSELGLQYAEAERAWQKMGCPPGGPGALELEIESDDEGEQNEAKTDVKSENETPLDPRAGHVDVVLPLLPVPAALLAEDLRQLMVSTACASKAYRRAKICVQRFEQLSKNVYPLGLKEKDLVPEPEEPLPKPEQSAKRLRALEKRLVASADELALRGLSRKHRKRLLAKTRAGLSIVDDVPKPTEAPADSKVGEWQIEEEKNNKKKKTEDTSNKENQAANKKRPNKKRKLDEQANKVQKAKKHKPENTKQVPEPKTRQDVAKLKTITESKINVNKVNNKITEEKKGKANNKKPVVTAKNKDDLVKKDNNEVSNAKKKRDVQTSDVKAKSKPTKATLVVNKVKHQNRISLRSANKGPSPKLSLNTPKKVKFVLKNNGAQGPVDYYKSVRQSPNIPFDSSKRPSKTNLKPSMPSPINPFIKKKLKLKKL